MLNDPLRDEILLGYLPWCDKKKAQEIVELRLFIEHHILHNELDATTGTDPYQVQPDDPLWQAISMYFAAVIRAHISVHPSEVRLEKIAEIVAAGEFIEDLGAPECVFPRGFDKTLEPETVIGNAEYCLNHTNEFQSKVIGGPLAATAFQKHIESSKTRSHYSLVRQSLNEHDDAIYLDDGQFSIGFALPNRNDKTHDVLGLPFVEHLLCNILLRDLVRGIKPRDVLLPDQHQVKSVDLLARRLPNFPFTYERCYLILSGIFAGLLPHEFGGVATIGLEDVAIKDLERLESFVRQFDEDDRRRMPPIFTTLRL